MVLHRVWVLVRVAKESVLRSDAAMRAGSIPAVPTIKPYSLLCYI